LTLKGPAAEVDLSDLECSLLIALCRSAGNRLETWQLLEVSGRAADEHGKRALEVQIVRLRKKVEQSGATGPSIKSIRGSGYQLCRHIALK
jgi:DNA-binding response OmpR family regulator